MRHKFLSLILLISLLMCTFPLNPVLGDTIYSRTLVISNNTNYDDYGVSIYIPLAAANVNWTRITRENVRIQCTDDNTYPDFYITYWNPSESKGNLYLYVGDIPNHTSKNYKVMYGDTSLIPNGSTTDLFLFWEDFSNDLNASDNDWYVTGTLTNLAYTVSNGYLEVTNINDADPGNHFISTPLSEVPDYWCYEVDYYYQNPFVAVNQGGYNQFRLIDNQNNYVSYIYPYDTTVSSYYYIYGYIESYSATPSEYTTWQTGPMTVEKDWNSRKIYKRAVYWTTSSWAYNNPYKVDLYFFRYSTYAWAKMQVNYIAVAKLGHDLTYSFTDTDDVIANQPPDIPILSSPANYASSVSRNVNLDWSDCEDAEDDNVSYTIIMGIDPNFNQYYTIEGLTDSNYTFPTAETLYAGQAYSWKVKSCDPTGCSIYSTPRQFQTIGGFATGDNTEVLQQIAALQAIVDALQASSEDQNILDRLDELNASLGDIDVTADNSEVLDEISSIQDQLLLLATLEANSSSSTPNIYLTVNSSTPDIYVNVEGLGSGTGTTTSSTPSEINVNVEPSSFTVKNDSAELSKKIDDLEALIRGQGGQGGQGGSWVPEGFVQIPVDAFNTLVNTIASLVNKLVSLV